MKRFIPAIAALALAASASVAQAQSAGTGMFRTAIGNELAHTVGISASVDGLSLAQLAQVRAVLEDDDLSTATKRVRIATITGRS